MASETKIVNWGSHSIVWVQSDDVQAALDILHKGEADGLGVSPHNGYKSNDISFLADVSNLAGVVLPYASEYDLSHLEEIRGLQFISVAGNKQPFDYGVFSDLEQLRIEWHSKLALPEPSAKLSDLYIRGYKPKSKNLTCLPVFENLVDIEINQGNLVNLEGIERLRELSSASFFHLRQLQSVDALVGTNVGQLHVEGCKKISGVEVLSGCPELESLRLIDCGKLRSLKFLEEFGKLDEFRFVNTVVEDGDMTPLLQMKSVGFLKKAGYSHTLEEIEQAIGKRST